MCEENLGVLSSIPSGLIKNEKECLEAIALWAPFSRSNFLAQTIAAKQEQSTALLMEIADMRHRYIRQVISDAAVLAGKWIELPDGNGRIIVHALGFSPRLLIPENGDRDYNISLGSVEIEYNYWIVVCRGAVTVWERPEKHTTGIKPEILRGAKVLPDSEAEALLSRVAPKEAK